MTTKDSLTEPCGLCLDYVAGLLSEPDRRTFERHLSGCEACRRELDDLQAVWEALPLELERMEPPGDLKEQIMEAARRTPARRRLKRPWLPRRSAALLSAVVLLLIAGTLLNVWLYTERSQQSPPTLDQALGVPASSIQRLVPLRKTAGTAAGDAAYGVACVVDSGGKRQFVVYVFGAAPTTGSEAYQVWLLRDGQRRSAGTFRVTGDKGIGLLAMTVREDEDVAFDGIGITLEPDDRGDKPRGAKAFGTA